MFVDSCVKLKRGHTEKHNVLDCLNMTDGDDRFCGTFQRLQHALAQLDHIRSFRGSDDEYVHRSL